MSKERGAVALWALLLLPVGLLLLGGVADYGRALALKADVAASCDLAALAAAQELDLARLAQGSRLLMRDEAEAKARVWFLSNAIDPLRRYGANYTIEVRVLNGGPQAPLREPWSGKIVRDPTVAIRVQVRLPTTFLRPVLPEVVFWVHANASVLAHP